jgi:hypothetical protein
MLRHQLLRDVENLNSAEGAAVWARRILPAKNTLHEADARQVEEAFEAKLIEINGQSTAHLDERSATSGSLHFVEAIIARFIATVTNASGGQNPALTRTLPHEVCGYSLTLRVRLKVRSLFWSTSSAAGAATW